MRIVRLPLGQTVDLDEDPPKAFDAGVALALAHEAVAPGHDSGDQVPVETPWGQVVAEVRGGGQLLVSTPSVEVTAPRVMVAVAAQRLDLPRDRIESSGMAVQELSLGRRVLVAPLLKAKDVEALEPPSAMAGVPGVSATGGVSYARTQRTPYAKVLGRLMGEIGPLTAAAAAAMHLVSNQGVRPSFPRTRVVVELVGAPGSAEVTVQARKAGHGPSIERVFVGGNVVANDKR